MTGLRHRCTSCAVALYGTCECHSWERCDIHKRCSCNPASGKASCPNCVRLQAESDCIPRVVEASAHPEAMDGTLCNCERCQRAHADCMTPDTWTECQCNVGIRRRKALTNIAENQRKMALISRQARTGGLHIEGAPAPATPVAPPVPSTSAPPPPLPQSYPPPTDQARLLHTKKKLLCQTRFCAARGQQYTFSSNNRNSERSYHLSFSVGGEDDIAHCYAGFADPVSFQVRLGSGIHSVLIGRIEFVLETTLSEEDDIDVHISVLLCGDVESNPGPVLSTLRKTIYMALGTTFTGVFLYAASHFYGVCTWTELGTNALQIQDHCAALITTFVVPGILAFSYVAAAFCFSTAIYHIYLLLQKYFDNRKAQKWVDVPKEKELTDEVAEWLMRPARSSTLPRDKKHSDRPTWAVLQAYFKTNYNHPALRAIAKRFTCPKCARAAEIWGCATQRLRLSHPPDPHHRCPVEDETDPDCLEIMAMMNAVVTSRKDVYVNKRGELVTEGDGEDLGEELTVGTFMANQVSEEQDYHRRIEKEFATTVKRDPALAYILDTDDFPTRTIKYWYRAKRAVAERPASTVSVTATPISASVTPVTAPAGSSVLPAAVFGPRSSNKLLWAMSILSAATSARAPKSVEASPVTHKVACEVETKPSPEKETNVLCSPSETDNRCWFVEGPVPTRAPSVPDEPHDWRESWPSWSADAADDGPSGPPETVLPPTKTSKEAVEDWREQWPSWSPEGGEPEKKPTVTQTVPKPGTRTISTQATQRIRKTEGKRSYDHDKRAVTFAMSTPGMQFAWADDEEEEWYGDEPPPVDEREPEDPQEMPQHFQVSQSGTGEHRSYSAPVAYTTQMGVELQVKSEDSGFTISGKGPAKTKSKNLFEQIWADICTHIDEWQIRKAKETKDNLYQTSVPPQDHLHIAYYQTLQRVVDMPQIAPKAVKNLKKVLARVERMRNKGDGTMDDGLRGAQYVRASDLEERGKEWLKTYMREFKYGDYEFGIFYLTPEQQEADKKAESEENAYQRKLLSVLTHATNEPYTEEQTVFLRENKDRLLRDLEMDAIRTRIGENIPHGMSKVRTMDWLSRDGAPITEGPPTGKAVYLHDGVASILVREEAINRAIAALRAIEKATGERLLQEQEAPTCESDVGKQEATGSPAASRQQAEPPKAEPTPKPKPQPKPKAGPQDLREKKTETALPYRAPNGGPTAHEAPRAKWQIKTESAVPLRKGVNLNSIAAYVRCGNFSSQAYLRKSTEGYFLVGCARHSNDAQGRPVDALLSVGADLQILRPSGQTFTAVVVRIHAPPGDEVWYHCKLPEGLEFSVPYWQIPEWDEVKRKAQAEFDQHGAVVVSGLAYSATTKEWMTLPGTLYDYKLKNPHVIQYRLSTTGGDCRLLFVMGNGTPVAGHYLAKEGQCPAGSRIRAPPEDKTKWVVTPWDVSYYENRGPTQAPAPHTEVKLEELPPKRGGYTEEKKVWKLRKDVDITRLPCKYTIMRPSTEMNRRELGKFAFTGPLGERFNTDRVFSTVLAFDDAIKGMFEEPEPADAEKVIRDLGSLAKSAGPGADGTHRKMVIDAGQGDFEAGVSVMTRRLMAMYTMLAGNPFDEYRDLESLTLKDINDMYRWKVFGKKDGYKPTKMDIGRTIQSPTFLSKALWVLCFAKNDKAWISRMPRGEASWVFAGHDNDMPVSDCRSNVYRRAKAALSLDMTAFDRRMPPWLIQRFFQYMSVMNQGVPQQLLDVMCEATTHSILELSDGQRFLKHAGNPSGFMHTLRLNCFVSLYIWVAYFLNALDAVTVLPDDPRERVKVILSAFHLEACGDDTRAWALKLDMVEFLDPDVVLQFFRKHFPWEVKLEGHVVFKRDKDGFLEDFVQRIIQCPPMISRRLLPFRIGANWYLFEPLQDVGRCIRMLVHNTNRSAAEEKELLVSTSALLAPLWYQATKSQVLICPVLDEVLRVFDLDLKVMNWRMATICGTNLSRVTPLMGDEIRCLL